MKESVIPVRTGNFVVDGSQSYSQTDINGEEARNHQTMRKLLIHKA